MEEQNHEEEIDTYKKGRGAQFNTKNKFITNESTREHIEGIDEWIEPDIQTQYIEVFPKSIVNKVESPDVGMMYSMNPTRAVSMAASIVMHATLLNTGAIAPGWILKARSSSRKMRRTCCANF
jgi:hypothetical protein